jgi:hypothetical protein
MIKFEEFVDRESEFGRQNFAHYTKSVARSPHFLLFSRRLPQQLDISNEPIIANARRIEDAKALFRYAHSFRVRDWRGREKDGDEMIVDVHSGRRVSKCGARQASIKPRS